MRPREIVFPKIKDFRKKMFEEQIAVYSYRYRYNCVRCFVAVCLLTDEDKKCDDAEYALIEKARKTAVIWIRPFAANTNARRM